MVTIHSLRTAYIPESDKYIGFENDNLVERRYFKITDASVFDYTFKLDIESTMDIVELAVAQKNENELILAWDITANQIGKGGVVRVQLRAFDETGAHIWHSAKMEFIAGSSINAVNDANNEHTLTEFEQIEVRVQNAAQTAQSASASALLYSDIAAECEASVLASSASARSAAETAAGCSEAAHSSAQSAAESADAAEKSVAEAKTAAESAAEAAERAENSKIEANRSKIEAETAFSEMQIIKEAFDAEAAEINERYNEIDEKFGDTEKALDEILKLTGNYIA